MLPARRKMTAKSRLSALELSPSAATERRMRLLFAAAAVAIIVMMVVNVVAIRLIANDNRELHDRATPSLLAAKSLTLAAADMNGAQNRYVLDFGSSRGDYIQSRDQLAAAITEATRHAETPGELHLIREISHLNTGFQTLDGQVYAAVLATNDTRARTLAAGPATTLYKQIRTTAEQLVVLTTSDRTAAFTKLTSAQRRAQIALVVLDAAALVLIGYLLVERRRAGRRLAAQHAAYRGLVERMPAVTAIYDRDEERFRYVSLQAVEILGVAPEEILSDPKLWLSRIDEEDRERIAEAYRAALEGDQTFDETYRFTRPDGAQRWLHNVMVGSESDVGRAAEALVFDVTEQVETEERYRSLVEQLPAAVMLADASGTCFWVSGQWEQLTGRPADWMLGATVPERFIALSHPDDRARISSWVAHREAEEPFTDRCRLQHADGHWIWVELQVVVVRDADGRTVYRQALIRDITDRIVTEARFQDLVEHQAPVTTLYDAPARTTLYLSPQVEQLTGHPPEYWLSDERNVEWWGWQVIHPDDRAAVLADWTETFSRDEVWEGSYRIIHRDGSVRWVADRDAPLAGTDGLRQGSTLDITDLVEHRDRYQELIEALPAAVVVWDPRTGGITYVSPQLESITGLSAEEWRARGVGAYRAMVHPDDRTEGFEQAIEAGESFSNTYRLRAADGQERWVTSTDHVLRNLAPFRQALVYDVTEEVAERTRHQDLLEALPAAVAVYDQDTGEITYASPQMEKLTGIPASGWLGRTVDDYLGMIHPADAQLIDEFQRELAAGTEALSFRYRLIAADGSERWVASTDNGLPGMTHMRQALLFDVTELHEAEQRSQDAVERLVRAGEEEQARMAGELHDDAVQVMTALLY